MGLLTMGPTFASSSRTTDHELVIERFRSSPRAPIPVWTAGRSDIRASVAMAEDVFSGRRIPPVADVGLWLGPDPSGTGVAPVVLPLARRWVTVSDILDAPGRETAFRVLVAGIWSDLRHPVLEQLRSSAREDGNRMTLGVLTGRDLVSLGWLAARQWAAIRPDLESAGFFSAIDRPLPVLGVERFGQDEFETKDIVKALTGRPWRRLLVQGHGKDDNINLGAFTLCGLSPVVGNDASALRPRCGYGPGHCFKDDDKVISLRLVPAAEMTLSSCYAAVLPPYESYGSQYQLLLAAIDGSAQTIVGGMGMHDSDAPENDAWLSALDTPGVDIGGLFNASLADVAPVADMLHVGLPPAPCPAPDRGPGVPVRVEHLADRLTAWRGSTLLPSRHRLRPRLDRLATKLDRLVSRRGRAIALREHRDPWHELWSDVQSLDHAIASGLAEDPRDHAAGFDTHFAQRSRVVAGSSERVTCQCGAPAQGYRRAPVAAPTPSTSCLLCPRCGYRVVAMEGAPELTVRADVNRVRAGRSLTVVASVKSVHDGRIKVALSAPGYLRADLDVVPALTTVAVKGGVPNDVTIAVRTRPAVPPQGYYVMVFAVQDLAVAACRQNIGIDENRPNAP